MANDKKLRDIAPQPTTDKLPMPRIIWSGKTDNVAVGNAQCRIVLSYVWQLPRDAEDWVSVPKYVFEVATTQDSMRQDKYEEKSLIEIPAVFFEDVIRAFDKTK